MAALREIKRFAKIVLQNNNLNYTEEAVS